jgi:hypothetical protein
MWASSYLDLSILKVKFDIDRSLVALGSRAIDFCFLLATTYLRHATRCLLSVEVELELEMENNFLHHLHCDFLTPQTSTITKSFQTGEVFRLSLFPYTLFSRFSSVRGPIVWDSPSREGLIIESSPHTDRSISIGWLVSSITIKMWKTGMK